MRFLKIMPYLVCIPLVGGCSEQTGAEPVVASGPQLDAAQTDKALTKKLELAEISQDINSIRELFAPDAVIYVPDAMPFAGNEAITSLYEYLWNNSENKTVNYLVEGAEITPEGHIEYGTNTSVNRAGEERASNFKAVYKPTDSSFEITGLYFGNAEAVEPELPAPTGEYGVGQARYYFAGDVSANGRVMAFQVWYPASSHDGDRAKHHSVETTIASAEFLGMPPFLFSFGSIVTSNSVFDAPVIPESSFPVLIYNHGYSGFTSVYQTVFEELASHGYMVVSIGHENESSLFIKSDGSITRTDPQNEFHASRSVELNGAEINSLQSTILNSNDAAEVKRAYEQLVQLSPLHNESTRFWASDTTQVMEKLGELNRNDPRLKGAFDLRAIGVMGHSVGGATAGQLAFNNDSIKAGINLDGFQFGDLVNNRLEVPFMFVSSNQNGDAYLRASSFMDESQADCYQAVLSGFSHGSFTDLTYFQANGPGSINLQRDLILSFFDRYVKQVDVDFEALDASYPELKLSKGN